MQEQRGNILFIILLAVVLFAALSYAVTNSIRGGGKDGGDENAKTAATDIINYATLIENEVMRAMLVGGVEWNELNFYNQFSRGVNSGSYANAFTSNPNCASIQASPLPCAIFTDRGGSIPPRHFWEYTTKTWLGSNGYPATGDARFYAKEVDNIGTPLSEIVMYIVQLKSSVCDAINEQLGLPLAVTTTSSNLTYFGQRDYWEGFDDPSKTLPWGDTNYLNQRTFCVKGSSGMGNVFVHVIVER